MNNLQKEFLFYIEWLYRNYGNNWNISDFPEKFKNNMENLQPFINELNEKGIIKLSDDGLSLTILELPSSISD